VVQVVPPPGYEIVKEEDKNILIGDAYTAAVTLIFPNGLGNVSILPDQALVGAVTGPGPGVAQPPCVGDDHIVPDFISLFPYSNQAAPFAGAVRPLCDKKEVVLTDQTQAVAEFYIFTAPPIAAHFT
jgi:hypothetical protein